MKNTITLLLSLALAQVCLGQNMLVSPPISIRNDYGYDLIGRLRDQILLFRDRADAFEIQAYDLRLQPTWDSELEDIEKRGTQILEVIGSRNDFSILYKTRRRGTTTLRLHKYDPGAQLIDSVTLKTYPERAFETPELETLLSDDKNCVVVYNKGKANEVQFTCFRIDKMQILWEKTLPVAESFFERHVRDLALSNAGELYLLTEQNNRRTRLDEHELQIHLLGTALDRIVRIPMPEYLTHDVAATFDNENRRFTAAGLFAERSRERANGAFYLSMPALDTVFTLKFNNFEDQFLSVMHGKELEEGDSKSVSNAEIQDLILRRDGGLLLVGELKQEITRGTAANRGFWREGIRPVIEYDFDDVFVLAFQPDGSPQWHTVLNKKQYSQDDEGIFSSFFLLRRAGQLRFLFNDEIKYENTCSEYVLDPLGHFDRNSLLTTENQDLRLRFRDGLQLNGRECLFPSEFRNKLRLVLLGYN